MSLESFNRLGALRRDAANARVLPAITSEKAYLDLLDRLYEAGGNRAARRSVLRKRGTLGYRRAVRRVIAAQAA